MMYTRGEDAWQEEEEAYAAGRDAANGQNAGAPPEEVEVKRKPVDRVKPTDPPESTKPNGPGKRNELNGPPTGTKLEETATVPDPDPNPDSDPDPDSNPDPRWLQRHLPRQQQLRRLPPYMRLKRKHVSKQKKQPGGSFRKRLKPRRELTFRP